MAKCVTTFVTAFVFIDIIILTLIERTTKEHAHDTNKKKEIKKESQHNSPINAELNPSK